MFPGTPLPRLAGSCVLLLSLIPATGALAPALAQKPADSPIVTRLKALRSLSDTERPAATRQLALDIRALPAGAEKVGLADALASRATEGDPGKQTLTDVAVTLAQSLAEIPPVPDAKSPGGIPQAYLEVASILRYEHVQIDSKLTASPFYARADQQLAQQDAEVQGADFTLKDLAGKPVTLSELRGKVVMVNFWATWCPPCRKEMPTLDKLNAQLGSQGLVILSISDEDTGKVAPFIAKTAYHPTVLLDPSRKVHEMFHVEGIPRSFVVDRSGKIVATAIDERSERQFREMFAAAGLKD